MAQVVNLYMNITEESFKDFEACVEPVEEQVMNDLETVSAELEAACK